MMRMSRSRRSSNWFRIPDGPNVHYVYGTYLIGDRPAEALEQFNIELRRWPEHVLARVQIAQELTKQSEFAGLPYATEAARLGPGLHGPPDPRTAEAAGGDAAARSRTWKPHARSSRPAPAFAIASRARISGQAGMTMRRESARSARAWRDSAAQAWRGKYPRRGTRGGRGTRAAPLRRPAAYRKNPRRPRPPWEGIGIDRRLVLQNWKRNPKRICRSPEPASLVSPLSPRPALSLPTTVVRLKLLLAISRTGMPHIGVFGRLKNSVRNSSLFPRPRTGSRGRSRSRCSSCRVRGTGCGRCCRACRWRAG